MTTPNSPSPIDSKKKIAELIERFRHNADAYKNGIYNETQVRREFIDPFFEALGWDISNRAGYAEQYKDVVHEDSIKVGVSLKAPDYSFRVGGQRKFFLEAKKPSVKIKEDVGPAYQLRRYAWSAKLPLSILTDFEELAVYDCRTKPDPNDKASVGRIAYYTYDQYLDKFDDIYGTFSKEEVYKGSFDRYAESSKGKKGTGEVDREFLKEIEKWRDSLARNLALRNPELDIYELNFAVQHTLDRIIFLRICEDRGIEGYGRLQGLLNGASVYERLMHLFTQADQKYNSGLFDFKTDRLSHNLNIDDKVLKEIVENLYYPKSPYEFSVLGADILGNVYEQFLGKVIRLTSGHQAKVEEKPEVKKSGGVYYTPQYIVEYIVKNTVGRLVGAIHELPLPKITPKDVSKIRVLDPACGSGSFLIGAYQYLLDWHLKWYRENDPEKHAKGKSPAVYIGAGKEWKLTTSEKKRILLNNMYGVDIDRQAVEVTKLSLLLKVLEDENQETIGKNLSMFHERILPSLENNIKCGNSLIGPDFYSQTPPNPLFSKEGVPKAGAFEDDDIRRINVFDWEKEFSEIMKSGGFDAVIGNPPYVIINSDIFSHAEVEYLRTFTVTQYKADLFHLFIQRGIELLTPNGRFGYIVPNPWLTLQYADQLRKFIIDNTKISEIVVFDHLVFQSANVHTALIFLEKNKPAREHKVLIKRPQETTDVRVLEDTQVLSVRQEAWKKEGYCFETRLVGEIGELVTKVIDRWPSLEEVARASLGCQAYNKAKHTPAQIANRVFHSDHKADSDYLPELAGNDIGRYEIDKKKGQWIKYGSWLHDYRTMDWLEGPRILIREVAGKPPYQIYACYVEETYCNYKTILNVNPSSNTYFSMKYLLGILNSRLLSFIYPYVSNKMVAKSFPRLSVGDVRKLPIRAIDFDNPKDKTQHDKIVSLVDRMLDLNKKLQTVRIAHDVELLERQIKITDDQIDQLVYELYGLTVEEITTVEEANR